VTRLRADGAHPETVVPVEPEASRAARCIIAVLAVLIVLTSVWHLAAVVLYVTPDNSMTRTYRKQVDSHIRPEFEQNWELFAPDPIQNNISVQARVQTATESPDARSASRWVDLTGTDVRNILHSPAPSHEDQLMVQRAWEFYARTHQPLRETPTSPDADVATEYLKRVALQRLGRDWKGRPIARVELQETVAPVPVPDWGAAVGRDLTRPRTLPWWGVTDADYRGIE
jgi:hypothetical protein